MHPKIGLVLGGGGSRGLAHIGVLGVLERENIPVDLIVGTSMGGIVGVLYALGLPPRRIAEEMEALQGTNLLSMQLFSARARQRSIADQLEPVLTGKTFADLLIPLTVMAVDMLTGQEVAISEGELLPAILATSAVPAVFPPVEYQDMLLSDGGVIDSLATHVAYEQGAERVIAVDIYPPLETDDPWAEPYSAIMGVQLPLNLNLNNIPSMTAAMWRAVRVMTWHLHEKRLETHPPDVLLRPDVGDYGSLDFKDVQGPMMAGTLEAQKHLDALRALVSSKWAGEQQG